MQRDVQYPHPRYRAAARNLSVSRAGPLSEDWEGWAGVEGPPRPRGLGFPPRGAWGPRWPPAHTGVLCREGCGVYSTVLKPKPPSAFWGIYIRLCKCRPLLGTCNNAPQSRKPLCVEGTLESCPNLSSPNRGNWGPDKKRGPSQGHTPSDKLRTKPETFIATLSFANISGHGEWKYPSEKTIHFLGEKHSRKGHCPLFCRGFVVFIFLFVFVNEYFRYKFY